ncbi:MAG: hypothetical protein K2M80_01100, partial [Muribaculaceae bacterium]|nr:hypothetical protein [Muribaculaceae bacterium]
MFYSPALNNEVELAKLFSCVDQYKEKINDHKVSLHVDGYSNSKASDKENLRIAKIRSNRVKSELITRKGLKEDNFVTHNHAEQGNFVTVRLFIPVEELLPSIEEAAESPVVPEAVDEVEEVIVAEEPASAQEPEAADQSELTEPAPTSEVAENIVYGAMDNLKKIAKDGDELAALLEVVDALKPAVEVKGRRVGGATYQVPVEVRPARQQTLALRWLVMFA